MFEYIKNILKNKCLKRAIIHAKRRKRVAHNFETAKTMGVIYSFNINMEAVLSILDDITKRYNIERDMIIYYPYQDNPPQVDQSSSSQIFFSTDKCNWFGKPKTVDINKFINTEFSILIDLSPESCFPLQYIAVSSHANFKIGRINDETNDLYDFVLLGSKDEEQFIRDLEAYLYKIK
ncbi:MAG: hypothetical protein LBS55_00950 [Prevotellaceae bacterium]|jgi:hypothetical protein|nr:hypothetical protein [Prevotellaceae bacterium]